MPPRDYMRDEDAQVLFVDPHNWRPIPMRNANPAT